MAVLREISEREEWNALVRKLGGSVLQSWEWGEFRSRHGWRPVRLASERAAVQLLVRPLPASGLSGALAYAPHGPVAGEVSAVTEAATAAAEHARGLGAILIDVEPRQPEDSGFKVPGFSGSGTSVQPRCTLVVEVRGDAEEQLSALPKDTRYGVRRARREGIVAAVSREEGDLEAFMDLHEETARRQGFALRPREYYRQFMRDLPARLIVARREGEERLLAGAVILTFGEEAYYLYGASSREGENLYASYLVQFEALEEARRAGARRYDMWGIPCRPHEGHPMWGVYKFKKKFGGRQERYVGTLRRELRPLRARVAEAAIRSYYLLQRLRGKSSGPLVD
ncbi:UDP-N-acetylmuramoylpentapeptide-lysine N(6)-alanyltransferase [Rubrobacter xylanophilus DSM 9941]|uniref:lipid II:glycine glycyltransferase FemX n=1 Tax=Rubrobacter xylanophilus TaxID=49319 RepID=UPI001C63FE68|nr:peptidoglycan bridge formation glycyltransferase FemA/FemB family protein [Rubrobacter xylanophilus]QYJ16991.1 UDP-N-acetylmuramoylpentapeptide-lysine N(6)-alanyltransferase [Rubrobacter xylanophilus DSM 9941]